jgi:ubiquinone/menaquinone biosynthesis C-methylase UbiE
MPDVYATIADADLATQERLAGILELRAADPQQRAMLDAYLDEVDLPASAEVLEIGCGTGAVSRAVAGRPDVAKVVGIDPSPVFVANARELTDDDPRVTFEEGDGRAVGFPDESFDAVVLHTVLCHIPRPEDVLAEAFRTLRPGGTLAVFDGDYSTISVALGEADPLQDCVAAVQEAFIHDIWLVRRLPALLRSVGFEVVSSRSHGYLQLSEPDYLLTIVDRGADALAGSGRIGTELAAALKPEARRRVEDGEFFGFIGFVSFISRRPLAR